MGNWRKKEVRKNEEQVAEEFGLRRTIGSGNTFLEKEDAIGEVFLAQIKSTKKNSISIKKADVELLCKNAAIDSKIPIFILDFAHGPYDSVKLVCFRDYDVREIIKLIEGANEE